MPITEEQRLARKNHIGSSDMAAVLGLNPYRNAADVWMEKTGRLIASNKPTDDMLDGTALEDRLLSWAEPQLGKLNRNVNIIIQDLPIATNIDAVIEQSGEPVEAKTTGFNGMPMAGYGQPETQEVPEGVIIQCHVHLMATNRDVCHVPVWVGGRGKGLYYVFRDKELVEIIAEHAVKFWRYVETDTQPPETIPSTETIKLIRREPNKIVQINKGLVEEWLGLKAEAKVWADKEEEAKRALMASLGDAEVGEFGEFEIVTYYEQKRKSYVVPEGTYRVLRISKKR